MSAIDKKLEDIEALWLSAEKWMLIWQGKQGDKGRADCACCELATRRNGFSISCLYCPILRHTGVNDCRGTPYMEWTGAAVKWWLPANAPEKKAAAEAEYRFLINLALKLADEVMK
jgi:hypothetical protein